MGLKTALSLAAVAGLAACAPSPAQNASQALNACYGGASHVEFRDSGTVVRVLGERATRSGDHEGFIVSLPGRAANGAVNQGVSRTWRVEDNTDITGPIPLHRGEAITLQGQLECNDYVIHWTHHDPRGRHAPGYIEVDGRRYQ